MRRVCITGIGGVCPLGSGVKYIWSKIMSGQSGIVSMDNLEILQGKTKSKVIGLVPKGSNPGEFDLDHPMFKEKMPRVNPKNLSTFIKYAIWSTQEALDDAGLKESDYNSEDVAVSLGNGLGGLDLIESKTLKYASLSNPDPSSILSSYGPYIIPSCLPNLSSGTVSMYFGFKGPNKSINTACASGLYAIEDGVSMIRNGDAKIVVAGATEGIISLIAVAGFDAMTALSRKYNDTPNLASRPYDKDRDGFVISEGAGILILEDLEFAQKRNAKIYAECLGCGTTSDAYNVSAPSGEGSVRAMQIALNKSNLKPEDIDYIGVHATSTPVGDKSEIESIRKIFGNRIPTLSAVKSSIGHMLAAASAIETVLLMKTLETGEIPPSINIFNPSDFIQDIDYVPDLHRKQDVRIVMKNSFGFGGANASSIFAKLSSAK